MSCRWIKYVKYDGSKRLGLCSNPEARCPVTGKKAHDLSPKLRELQKKSGAYFPCHRTLVKLDDIIGK